MSRNRWFRFVMMVAAGGMVFQATAGCDTQLLDTLTAAVVPALTSAVVAAITGGLAA